MGDPITIELTPNDFILIETLKSHFKLLGFEIEAFGKNTVIVQGTPAELGEFNTQEMIESILESYKLNTFDVKMDPFENLCKSMAKSASIKYGKQLEAEEMTMILENLFMSTLLIDNQNTILMSTNDVFIIYLKFFLKAIFSK